MQVPRERGPPPHRPYGEIARASLASDATLGRERVRSWGAPPDASDGPATRGSLAHVTASDLTRLTAETLYLVLLVSAPALAAALVVGLVVGLLQAVTQVQEQTLAFVPKLVAVALTLAVLGGWMSSELVRFTSALWLAIPRLVP